MVLIAFICFGLLLSIWIFNEYSFFLFESKSLRGEYLDSQKDLLRNEVNHVVKHVNYMKSQTEKKLKSELRGRVYDAIAIAENIYQENAASGSLDEIKKMVKDALRPIRFLNGRGYYFAFSMGGIETLFADRPEMEGVNMLPIQGAKGEYVVKDMIDIVNRQKEGFYQYTWTKPSHVGKHFPKIAYVKYFKPFDWAFGTGEYLDDFSDQIQEAVLEMIVGLRFGDEGHFFGRMEGGYPLFSHGKKTKGSDRIWNMSDSNGVKFIQEQQKAAANPEGGFVQYVWQKSGSPGPSPKISFVRGIPGWRWTIGADTYLDNIEEIIAGKEALLKRELIKKIIASILVFIGLIVLIWFWANRVAGQTRRSIRTFESFFKKATNESVTIPEDGMQFRELSRIALSANKMIESQKRYEKALRDSEKRFRELFNHMSAGVAIYESPDNGQRFLFKNLNTAGLKNAQKKKEDVVGREVRDVFPGIEALGLFDVFKRVWKTGNPEHHPTNLYQDDKVMLWVENYVCKLPSGELVAIYEDTTARKKAEEEKKGLEKQLLQTQKLESIGTLAGGIAHDFNNILSSIFGYTELLIDDVEEGSLLEDHLLEVYTAAKRARDLVKQILLFARQSDEELKPIRIDTIATETLKLIRSSAPTTIEILQQIESKSLIMGNSTQVHQVLMNLCTNAVHAMEDKGGVLKVGLVDVEFDDNSPLKPTDLKPGYYVKLTVSDTGSGIAQDIREIIFEPYFTTKGVGEGTGMGLSMVHGIVETYGGKIFVDSELGKGTMFSVYLPITKKQESYRPYAEENLPTGTENILLVDDELPIAKMAGQILSRLGYSVTTRTSSVEALELFDFKPNDFDLVVTDMTMPNMTGDQLAIELMKIRSDIPVILCTGYSKKITDETATRIGIKAIAYKPIVKADLAKTVRKVLDAVRSGDLS